MTGSGFPKAMNNSLYPLSGAATRMHGTIPLCPRRVNESPRATNLPGGGSLEFGEILLYFISALLFC